MWTEILTYELRPARPLKMKRELLKQTNKQQTSETVPIETEYTTLFKETQQGQLMRRQAQSNERVLTPLTFSTF